MINTRNARACVGFAHSDAPKSLLLWPGWRLSPPGRERRPRPPAMPGDVLDVVRKAESAKVPGLFLGLEGWVAAWRGCGPAARWHTGRLRVQGVSS